MRISKFTDFSLRVLLFLASQPEGQLSSVQYISSRYGISQNHLIKVVSKLGKLGYIKTFRGKNGGIRLALRPDAINIGVLISEVEMHLDGVNCHSPACALFPECRLHEILASGVQAFISTMRGYTLADILIEPSTLSQLLQTQQCDIAAKPSL